MMSPPAPVVMLIEDLQWIDRASEDLVRRSLGQVDFPRLLVLSTRRPQYEPPWSGAANVAELHLTPLSEGRTIDLLKTRLSVEEVPEALAGLIALAWWLFPWPG